MHPNDTMTLVRAYSTEYPKAPDLVEIVEVRGPVVLARRVGQTEERPVYVLAASQVGRVKRRKAK